LPTILGGVLIPETVAYRLIVVGYPGILCPMLARTLECLKTGKVGAVSDPGLEQLKMPLLALEK
jgi:hypothetical protein